MNKDKVEALRELFDSMTKKAYGITFTEAFERNICIDCKKPVNYFADETSRREYYISGLCQNCQEELVKDA